jgi:twitching motility protein PilT
MMTTAPRIDEYVRKLVGLGATDLLLSSERPPLYRAANELLPLPGEGLVADADLRSLLEDLLDADEQQALQDDFRVSFQAQLLGGLRGAGSCHLAQHGLTLRLRLLGGLDLAQIDLALPPNVPSLLQAEAGLIIVTGPAGSGKSSWIARCLSLMAAQRPAYIATIDEPVEYVLPPGHGPLSQRSIGRHCRTFAEGIDAALEANAQVIACSDLRAPGVFERMLEAAGSGVLALGEVRGYGAIAALDQLLSAAPAAARTQLAGDLADTLVAAVSLDLVPRKGGGRALALELLSATPNACSLLRDGKTQMLSALLDRDPGMQSMDRCLLDLATRNVIEGRDAHARATDKRAFAAWA